MLAQHPAAKRIRATDLVAQLTGTDLPLRQTLELFATAGMLDDDRIPAIRTWFERQIVGLPPTMANELRVWFDVLYEGSTTTPRSRPRSPTTIRIRVYWALPTLRAWAAAGHQSLREISRGDVAVSLPPSGNPRATLGLALRSIFATLKAHKVIFVNPIARTKTGQIERRQPLPSMSTSCVRPSTRPTPHAPRSWR